MSEARGDGVFGGMSRHATSTVRKNVIFFGLSSFCCL